MITVDDGFATAQAADANSNSPAATQPDRVKVGIWNHFSLKHSQRAPFNSTQGMPSRQRAAHSAHQVRRPP
jgi:hypothetical protein